MKWPASLLFGGSAVQKETTVRAVASETKATKLKFYIHIKCLPMTTAIDEVGRMRDMTKLPVRLSGCSDSVRYIFQHCRII